MKGRINMPSNIDIFTSRLTTEWLPAFCNDQRRKDSIYSFSAESIKVSEFDVMNFMRALDHELVKDRGGGRYRCARSYAHEQIFTNGLKSKTPRSLTLWIEPVITIGTIARLGLDYGWPSEQLGMQSKDWAFDFAVYELGSSEKEYIAGEVKKTPQELDQMIENLQDFGRRGLIQCDFDDPKQINSFKKWIALRTRQAPLFWAVGPNDYTKLFAVEYRSDHSAKFSQVPVGQLTAK